MKKVIVATGNTGKTKEIKSIFNTDEWTVVTMKEEGLNPTIVEDGKTFEENSLIKSRTVMDAYKKKREEHREDNFNDDSFDEVYVFADDSGLEVDALNKEPGVLSARYMGEDTSYRIKNQSIIDRLEGVEGNGRSARFVCALSAIDLEGQEYVVRETMEGFIGYKEAGENGFGYDPIFMLPEYGCTSAEIPMEEKNKISHRGKAIKKMLDILSGIKKE